MPGTFKRGQNPLIALGIGKKTDEGLIITDQDLNSFRHKPDFILEGFVPEDIYTMKHLFAGSIIGVCSGKKSWKVLKNYMKKQRFTDHENRWIWKSSIVWYAGDKRGRPQGGVLKHQYRSAENGRENPDFWVDSNHDISFSSCNGLIMEL